MMQKFPVLCLGLACVFLTLGARAGNSSVDSLEKQAEAAAQAAAAGTVEPNEINNIKRRRLLNGKPGVQQYVVFLSKSGQPIDYFVVKGKCTSSTKRLTPEERLVHGDRGKAFGDFVMKAPGEDGTFGSSSPYIYCFTVDGKYKQWSGRYYASDYPIELTIKPLIIDVSGRNQSQQ